MGPEKEDLPIGAAAPELACPHCEYSLKGLSEDRCPECGEPFDRGRLIRWHVVPDLTLRYTRTARDEQHYSPFLSSIVSPARVGRELPCRPALLEAVGASWIVRGSAVLVLVLTAGLGGASSGALSSIFLASAVVAAVTQLCEIAIAKMLEVMLDPVAVPREGRYEFWLALCACFSSYFLLSCAILSLSIAAATWLWPRRISWPLTEDTLVAVLSGVMLLWWWLALSRAIAARSDRSVRQIVALLLVPIIGIAPVAVGAGVLLVLGA